MHRSVITGTGCYIPGVIKYNEDFVSEIFYEESGKPVSNPSEVVIEKFTKITGIKERRYAPQGYTASEMAADAGRQALLDSQADPETLDQIIVAHNFGDVAFNSTHTQNVPSLANKVKHLLGIQRPECIAYDIVVGCPGWVQSLIQTDAYFKAGMAKKALLIGSETLSRVIDPVDRDSMLFADGAGACVLEYRESKGEGILGSAAQAHSIEESCYIKMGRTYRDSDDKNGFYMKMKGRKVYEYAIKHVPLAMKQCLDNCGIQIGDLSKIFLHQANEKMDEEIMRRFFALYGIAEPPPGIMPMSIHWLGNSSVATVPTLYHLVRKGETPGHELETGNVVLFASVGAGMNINAVAYRI